MNDHSNLHHLGQDVIIREYVIFVRPERISVGNHVEIDSFVIVAGGMDTLTVIGNYVHIACFCSLDGRGGVVLRDFTGVSAGCRLFTSDDDYVSGGLMGPMVPAEYRSVRTAPIVLERFATVGANCVVLPGVTIGEGATVGAGSLVKADIEPWTVNVGTPCKPIKTRNRDEVLRRAESLQSQSTTQLAVHK